MADPLKVMRRLLPAICAALCAAAVLPGAVHAQAYPSHAVKGINPFPPGGPSDVIGRIVSEKLSRRLGQSFVMENRAGAGGNIGIEALAKSPPDGYTLAWIVDFNLTVNPALYPKMPYDIEKDIAPVSLLATGEIALVVNPGVAANNLGELIALAKAKPLAFASGGNGSPGHMVGELFKRELNLPQLVHVPYKGNTPANQSILAGETQLFFGALPGSLPFVQAGKLKALAVMSRQRSPFLPEVPTTTELGYPKLQSSNWFGLIAPGGTPRTIIDLLNREVAAVVKEPEFAERIGKIGLLPKTSTPEEMRALIRSDGAAWAAVARAANIKAE